ncbi:MAG: flagellar motor protein MotB [Alkaliphilus sp.]
MPKKKKQQEAQAGAPAWMATYGDMVTLLLCFFVLLFAFSTIDAEKFQAIITAFQGSIGIMEDGTTVEPTEFVSEALQDELTTSQQEELEDFRKLQEQLEAFLETHNLQADVLVTLETIGLVLRLQDNVLFDSGKSELKSDSFELLSYLSTLLKQSEFLDKNVRIEGHTDSDPLRFGARYETNWELSVARASRVVRYLIEVEELAPQRFTASGYSMFHPIAPNDTAENKSKNRRVDIVILRAEMIVDFSN